MTDFVKKAKLTGLENKIPDISNLATKTALTVVENKMPSVSILVKKTSYNTKITEIEKNLTDHNHDNYILTSDFNKLAADVFNARLARANLVSKTIFDNTVSNLNSEIEATKTANTSLKNLLKRPEKNLFELFYW